MNRYNGEVFLFAGGFQLPGASYAHGQELPVKDLLSFEERFQEWRELYLSSGLSIPADFGLRMEQSILDLYHIVGTEYGGDPGILFRLPNLRGPEPGGVNYAICFNAEHFPTPS